MAEPKTLANPSVRKARIEMLNWPEMKPLTCFVNGLRADHPDYEFPDFDPMDGGTSAQYLFLFEKPGRRAVASSGSGFISRDNPDNTAAAILCFMAKAGIERQSTVIWNLVPGWNRTRKVTASERADGLRSLLDLLILLRKIEAIVLVGNNAQLVIGSLCGKSYKIFRSLHPSPIVKGTRRKEWNDIWRNWARVKDSRSKSDC
ncbi:MAG: uracil-DNA glycosylase [Pseudolabrys sp.]